jgi:ubiquinone/menaquinone biosynthesis C-methylase UbiE
MVTITDLAENMLQVAQESARRRGLTNVETRQADAGALPFADATFDAVTARFGFMFFPDVLGAARELARVARPGARVTTAVWGAPEKNPWATTIMGTIAKHVDLPAPPPARRACSAARRRATWPACSARRPAQRERARGRGPCRSSTTRTSTSRS